MAGVWAQGMMGKEGERVLRNSHFVFILSYEVMLINRQFICFIYDERSYLLFICSERKGRRLRRSASVNPAENG